MLEALILAAGIVCREARSETFRGQMAVAYVIKNRVQSPGFPKTVKDVIQQPNQFHGLSQQTMECRIGSRAYTIALKAVEVAFSDDDDNHAGLFFERCDGRPTFKDLVLREANHCFYGAAR